VQTVCRWLLNSCAFISLYTETQSPDTNRHRWPRYAGTPAPDKNSFILHIEVGSFVFFIFLTTIPKGAFSITNQYPRATTVVTALTNSYRLILANVSFQDFYQFYLQTLVQRALKAFFLNLNRFLLFPHFRHCHRSHFHHGHKQ
jgi:hypothetical protein